MRQWCKAKNTYGTNNFYSAHSSNRHSGDYFVDHAFATSAVDYGLHFDRNYRWAEYDWFDRSAEYLPLL